MLNIFFFFVDLSPHDDWFTKKSNLLQPKPHSITSVHLDLQIQQMIYERKIKWWHRSLGITKSKSFHNNQIVSQDIATTTVDIISGERMQQICHSSAGADTLFSWSQLMLICEDSLSPQVLPWASLPQSCRWRKPLSLIHLQNWCHT